MIKTILSSSLAKQLLGAAGGALVALSLFAAYREAQPMVMAYVLPHEFEEGKEAHEAKEFIEVGMVAVTETSAMMRLRNAAVAARRVRLHASDPAPVVASVASDVEVVPLPSVTMSTAPALPNAGIGIGMSGLIALCISAVLRQRRLSRSPA